MTDNDLISRQAAIDALRCKGQASRRYKLGETWELNLDEIMEAIGSVPTAIQKGEPMNDLISRKWLMECVNEGWIKFDTEKDKNIYVHLVRDIAPSARPEIDKDFGECEDDLISRQAAIDALWKAMYEFEDKMEKQFSESDNLDVYDWIQHRIFVQNMSDIDRKTILDLPSAQPELLSDAYMKQERSSGTT